MDGDNGSVLVISQQVVAVAQNAQAECVYVTRCGSILRDECLPMSRPGREPVVCKQYSPLVVSRLQIQVLRIHVSENANSRSLEGMLSSNENYWEVMLTHDRTRGCLLQAALRQRQLKHSHCIVSMFVGRQQPWQSSEPQ
jgi:hypothetical protein